LDRRAAIPRPGGKPGFIRRVQSRGMVRRHTTDPVPPVSRIAPISEVNLHRLSGPARVMFAEVQHFYRDRLRKMRKRSDAPDPDSGSRKGAESQPPGRIRLFDKPPPRTRF
jgi:hypothetical protein